jgi:A/G-specific adenine glycosylase
MTDEKKQTGFDSSFILHPSSLRGKVARHLLPWFDAHQRDLPWRRDRDPYRIWVSEIMLQQTQVATVIPYFERFLTTFPTLADLARADEQDVLRLWAGLGYYRRARDLHRSARQLAALGGLVDDPASLAELPGFGRYTLNAVLSQAYDRRLPILEANSQRVLSRLFGRADDPRGGAARRWLWQAAEALLPTRRVGAFNQALMELGALVCTPTAPGCDNCPLQKCCSARRQGRQEEIPARSAGPAITEVHEAAVVITRGDHVLLVQRPSKGRWANMWEFPHGERQPGEDATSAAVRLAAELTGMQVELGPELMTLRHAITRYRVVLSCFEANCLGGEFRSEFYVQGLWLAPEELGSRPLSAPQRRLITALTKPGRQRRMY